MVFGSTYHLKKCQNWTHSEETFWTRVHQTGSSLFSKIPVYEEDSASAETLACHGIQTSVVPFQGGISFVDCFCYLCYVSVMLSCLFIAALWSPACEIANLLALLCVMFYCVFVTLPCGVLWYLIVSISDLCLLTYFYEIEMLIV